MKKRKTQTLEILAIILIASGIILIFVGLFIPPLGIIHSSALCELNYEDNGININTKNQSN